MTHGGGGTPRCPVLWEGSLLAQVKGPLWLMHTGPAMAPWTRAFHFPPPHRWTLAVTALAHFETFQKCLWLGHPQCKEHRPHFVWPHRIVRHHFLLSLINCNHLLWYLFARAAAMRPRLIPGSCFRKFWKFKTEVSARLAPWGLWLTCLSSRDFHTAHACVLTSCYY